MNKPKTQRHTRTYYKKKALRMYKRLLEQNKPEEAQAFYESTRLLRSYAR